MYEPLVNQLRIHKFREILVKHIIKSHNYNDNCLAGIGS